MRVEISLRAHALVLGLRTGILRSDKSRLIRLVLGSGVLAWPGTSRFFDDDLLYLHATTTPMAGGTRLRRDLDNRALETLTNADVVAKVPV